MDDVLNKLDFSKVDNLQLREVEETEAEGDKSKDVVTREPIFYEK